MTATNKVFYFDLEETLITSFNKPTLVNENTIEDYILLNNIKEIGIFSAAINDTRDKGHFIDNIKAGIEKRYNVTIVEERILMLQQLADMFMDTFNISMSVSEMLSLYGKDGIFKRYCKVTYKTNKRCYLIDDSYENELNVYSNRNLFIEIININSF